MTPTLAEVIALLPCPFCGKDAAGVEIDEEVGLYQVVCDASTWNKRGGCGTATGYQDTPEEASTAWNTRTSAASLRDDGVARDAERYRFLQKHAAEITWALGLDDAEEKWESQADGFGEPDYTLDAAIDAATQPAAQERQA